MAAAIVRIARRMAVALFLAMAIVQVLIAVRWLPQNLVWGGSHQQPTIALSLASLLSAAILSLFAYVIHIRGGGGAVPMITMSGSSSSQLLPSPPSPLLRASSWFVTAYMLLNTVGNLLSTNKFEKYVFGSVTAILAVCCCVVSLSSPTDDNYEPV